MSRAANITPQDPRPLRAYLLLVLIACAIVWLSC